MFLIKIIVIKETTFWVFEYEFWVLIKKMSFWVWVLGLVLKNMGFLGLGSGFLLRTQTQKPIKIKTLVSEYYNKFICL